MSPRSPGLNEPALTPALHLRSPQLEEPVEQRLDQVGLGMDREDQRRPGLLVEVEVFDQVAQLGGVLAYVGARVGPSVGGRVEALAVQEVVFDELDVGVEAERLVVDEALL